MTTRSRADQTVTDDQTNPENKTLENSLQEEKRQKVT